jgi:hypothetical protein
MEFGWRLQRPPYYPAFIFFLLTLAVLARAQGNETITFKSARSIRHLTGVITYTDGTVIPGVIVADCDLTYDRVLASTKTDASGNFSFPHTKLGSKHYLKIDFPAYQKVHMPVKIWPFAKARLRIRLTPGT